MAISPPTLALRPMPSLGACAARLARCRHQKGALAPGATIPRIEAYATFTADHQRLAAYREICGLREGPTLPLTWPCAVAAPLHLHVITAPDFPLPALGLVHVREVVIQTVPIPARADLHVHCRVDGHRLHRRGVELDLITEVALRPGAAAVWRSVTTALWRRSDGAQALAEASAAAPIDGDRWLIGADIGRRYAWIARTFDPIALHALTSRWFGFQRPLLPEMWTLARSLAALAPGLVQAPVRVDARFLAPIFLPGEVLFAATQVGEHARFAVHPLQPTWAGRAHLEGEVSRL